MRRRRVAEYGVLNHGVFNTKRMCRKGAVKVSPAIGSTGIEPGKVLSYYVNTVRTITETEARRIPRKGPMDASSIWG